MVDNKRTSPQSPCQIEAGDVPKGVHRSGAASLAHQTFNVKSCYPSKHSVPSQIDTPLTWDNFEIMNWSGLMPVIKYDLLGSTC